MARRTTIRCLDCRSVRTRRLERCAFCFNPACQHRLRLGSYGMKLCQSCWETDHYEELLRRARDARETPRPPKPLAFAFTKPCVAADIATNGPCAGGHHHISPHGHALCDAHLSAVRSGRELDIGGAKILLALDTVGDA